VKEKKKREKKSQKRRIEKLEEIVYEEDYSDAEKMIRDWYSNHECPQTCS